MKTELSTSIFLFKLKLVSKLISAILKYCSFNFQIAWTTIWTVSKRTQTRMKLGAQINGNCGRRETYVVVFLISNIEQIAGTPEENDG